MAEEKKLGYEIFAYPEGNAKNEMLIYQPGNREALVMSPKLTREVSKGGSLVFTMLRSHPHYNDLTKMRTVVSVHQDGKEIWRGRVLSHEADWLNRRVVYCEGALSYFNDTCITPFNYRGKLADFLQNLIDIHNSIIAGRSGETTQGMHPTYPEDRMRQFELGKVTAALGDQVVTFGDKDRYGVGQEFGSIWEVMSKMVLKTYGGYVYCTYNSETGLNVLNYCDQAYEADRQTKQNIEYGVNLLDFTEKTDTNNMYTRIWPLGATHTVTTSYTDVEYDHSFFFGLIKWGKHYNVYTESHEERYSIIKLPDSIANKYLPSKGYSWDKSYCWIQNDTAVKKFGVVSKIVEFDINNEEKLFAAAVQALQQNDLMVMSYEIKAVDLVDAGYDTQRLTFASYAHIISKPHSIDSILLCTKLVEPLDHPEKKEFTFGMTRKALTDRQVDNLGKVDQLSGVTSASKASAPYLLKQIQETGKKAEEAGKTATNFLKFTPEDGLIIQHESLPGQRVEIASDGVKVRNLDSMVNIQSDGISITDGQGSCSIHSGNITFQGIQNRQCVWFNYSTSYSGGAVTMDLSDFSAIMVLFRSYKNGDWQGGIDSSGITTAIIPVNGVELSLVYPWNTPQRRSITAYKDRIVFGSGYEHTARYYKSSTFGSSSRIDLQNPSSEGWRADNGMCIPYEIYGFI